MRPRKNISRPRGERGVVILLVAIFLLFVVGAMAVLAIDVVTFYTARSEAQLAADGAALAGARVLANSGMTSSPTDIVLVSNAENLASGVATQVAIQNKVGGRLLNAPEVNVGFPVSALGTHSDALVTVKITRNDLPTFFARIWGRTHVAVSASATAEAYNPSGGNLVVGSGAPIAPVCVKPWLIPNKDVSGAIFNVSSGAITASTTVGSPVSSLKPACSDCSGSLPTPTQPWQFYPAGQTSFPAPTQSLQTCSAGFNSYQLSVAGCVQTPIACGDGSVVSSTVDIDRLAYATDRTADTAAAVNCLSHSLNNNGDKVDTSTVPSPPLQFVAGADNPITGAIGSNVLVSDSLVTVPVFDDTALNSTSSTVQVIGFVQLFINPDGNPSGAAGPINAKVVNYSGCGTTATGRPILGTGASAIPVRLISR